MANDTPNAAPVEAPRRSSQEAPSPVAEASGRGVSEAYDQIGRNSLAANSTSADNQKLDAFGKANNGLESVGVTSDSTTSVMPGDAGTGPATGRINADGSGRLPEPREKGAAWMQAGDDNSFSAGYRPQERNDRRATLDEYSNDSGFHRIETFKGRADGKLRQETTEKGTAYEGTQQFDSTVRADGLKSEHVKGDTTTRDVTRTREFDPNKHPHNMAGEVVSTSNGVTTAERNFQGRQDGMLTEKSVKGPNGEQITQNFKDGGRVETSVAPDGTRVTTAYDQSGKVLPEGRPKEGTPASDATTGPKGEKLDPKQIEEHMKKFEQELTKKNELPALRKGEGPYQALQRGIKEGTIPPMSPKELLTEARRIRDRDLTGDKKTYKVGEKIGRESKEEIGKKVAAERQRVTGSEATPPRPPQELVPGPEGERTPPRPPEGERAPEGDRTEPPAENTPEGRLKASRERLDKAAGENIKTPEERKTFAENMKKFEDRAKKEGLSPDEVAKSYDSLTRMMTAPQTDSKLPSAEQRAILAQNFMHHAADPRNVDQGLNNTCNVSSMQERLLTRTPSKMADMLEQASTKGQYTAADGTTIKLDPNAMKPMRGFDSSTPTDNTRSYATQILNHTMLNEITQRKNPPEFHTQLTNNRDENGKPLEQGDTGERLRRGGFNGPDIKSGLARNLPGVSIYEMNASMERYTGEKSTMAMARNIDSSPPKDDNVIKFGSAEELGRELEKAQREGRMPVILLVDGNDPALKGRPGQSSEWGAHVVTIRGYDPRTGQVDISNQWGSGNDRKMDINRLYQSTKPPAPARPPEHTRGLEHRNMSYDLNPIDNR